MRFGGEVEALSYTPTDGAARAIVLARLAESRQRSTVGQGVVRVDAFFSSFFRAERKDNMGFGGIPHSIKWKRFSL